MRSRIIIEGNSVYEIDEECMAERTKRNQKQREEADSRDEGEENRIKKER